MIVHATVKGGRFVADEPTDLPDGTQVDMFVVEDGLDDMEPEEHAALMAALDRSMDEIDAGAEMIPAEVVLAELRARR